MNDDLTPFLTLLRREAAKIAARLPPFAIGVDDLIAYGWFGLRQASARFDPSRGVPFEVYCLRRVVGAMIDGLRQEDWVPKSRRATIGAPQQWNGAQGEDSPLNFARCREPSPFDSASGDDLFEFMVTRFTRGKEQAILRGCFRDGLTLKAIGDILGISESRCSQIRTECLARLAFHLKREGIE